MELKDALENLQLSCSVQKRKKCLAKGKICNGITNRCNNIQNAVKFVKRQGMVKRLIKPTTEKKKLTIKSKEEV